MDYTIPRSIQQPAGLGPKRLKNMSTKGIQSYATTTAIEDEADETAPGNVQETEMRPERDEVDAPTVDVYSQASGYMNRPDDTSMA